MKHMCTLGNKVTVKNTGEEMDKLGMEAVVNREFSYQREATNGLSERLVLGSDTARCFLR